MENMVKCLNELLSDLNVFYRKVQNYHWNIVGKDFFVIHEKLEEYYNEINEQIDEVAEHILILGNEPLGTMKDYLANTCIEEAKNEKIKDCDVFTNIIKDLEKLLQKKTKRPRSRSLPANLTKSSPGYPPSAVRRPPGRRSCRPR